MRKESQLLTLCHEFVTYRNEVYEHTYTYIRVCIYIYIYIYINVGVESTLA